jgi:hypothetical protein
MQWIYYGRYAEGVSTEMHFDTHIYLAVLAFKPTF